MLYIQPDCLTYIALPLVHCLTRQTVNQVNADIPETGLFGCANRRESLFGIMPTSYRAQFGIIKRLHTHAQSVHS